MGEDNGLIANQISELLNFVILLIFGICFVLLFDEFFHLVIPVEGAHIQVQAIQ